MNINFFHAIQVQLLAHPEKELIIWPGCKGRKAYTGREILQKIADIRGKLEKQNIKPGNKIVPVLPVGFDLVCAILAIMSVGAIPVLPAAKSQALDILRLVRKEKIKSVLLPQEVKWPLKWLAHFMGCRIVNVSSPVAASFEAGFVLVPPGQAALISHSSGSTGQPKAIYRSHQVLTAQHLVLKKAFPPLHNQKDFPLFPNILLHNLSLGCTTILPDVPWQTIHTLNPHTVLCQIAQEQVNTLTGNVFYFNTLVRYLERHPQEFEQVEALGIGGSPVPDKLVHSLKKYFPKADIYIIYGSSEAEPIAIRRVQGEKLEPASGYGVGTPVPGLKYRLALSGTVKVADRTYPVGEIEVQGDHVALQNGKEWLSTGDFAYIDKQNHLFLTGRKGNEKIQGGTMHYQVEHVILDHFPVARAAALVVNNGFDLYIQGQADAAEIRKLLDSTFPGIYIGQVNFRDSLPVDNRHYSKILYANLT